MDILIAIYVVLITIAAVWAIQQLQAAEAQVDELIEANELLRRQNDTFRSLLGWTRADGSEPVFEPQSAFEPMMEQEPGGWPHFDGLRIGRHGTLEFVPMPNDSDNDPDGM